MSDGAAVAPELIPKALQTDTTFDDNPIDNNELVNRIITDEVLHQTSLHDASAVGDTSNEGSNRDVDAMEQWGGKDALPIAGVFAGVNVEEEEETKEEKEEEKEEVYASTLASEASAIGVVAVMPSTSTVEVEIADARSTEAHDDEFMELVLATQHSKSTHAERIAPARTDSTSDSREELAELAREHAAATANAKLSQERLVAQLQEQEEEHSRQSSNKYAPTFGQAGEEVRVAICLYGNDTDTSNKHHQHNSSCPRN